MQSLCKLISFLFLGSLLLSRLRAFAQAGGSAWNDVPSGILLDYTPPSFMSPLRCTFSEQPFSSPASPPPCGCNPWLDCTFMLSLPCVSLTYTRMYDPWNLVVVFFFFFNSLRNVFHTLSFFLNCCHWSILDLQYRVQFQVYSVGTCFVFADYIPL